MGRKSHRGKEKKKKMKEEHEKMHIKQQVVDAANALDDPMSLLVPFKKFDRNGLSVSIECSRAADLPADTMDWAFKLVKDNMQLLYEASEWGWSDGKKREEMEEEAAWYLVARQPDGEPVAVVHFRFDIDEEQEVLYCYEIQLIKSVRRKGLGKFLMQILELLAHKTAMKKVVLTVFKHNSEAHNFFVTKLKYSIDESSPEESVAEAMFADDAHTTYQILSKTIAASRTSQTTPLTPHNGHPVVNATS